MALFARPSPAQRAELSLPEGCGSAREFELEVERRLGTGAKMPTVNVELTPQENGYRLRMLVGSERRELEDADCHALFRAAVVITVAITLSETREQRRAEPAPAPPRATSEPEAPAAPPARRATRGPEIALALGGGVNFGLLPRPSPQLELFGKLGGRSFGVGLAARYLPASDRRDGSGRGVSVQALGGELAALYRLGLLEASLAASAHLLLGSGIGEGKRDDSAWAIGPAAGLTFLPFQNSWMWLGVGGELYWNVVAPEFEILKYGTIFSSSTVSGSLFLRIGPRFP